MRRLLQLGTMLLMLVTLLVPISEALDRWDAPGLTHDTEFRLFVIVMLLALVLIVARLVASVSFVIRLILFAALPARANIRLRGSVAGTEAAVSPPPLLLPPLRI